MIQTSLPTRVTPASCAVPRLIVTYSRMVLPSPISTPVGSPAYFLSWGAAPIDAKCQMRLRRPIRVWPSSTTCVPIQLPSPTSTCSPITENGPTSTSAASRAPRCTSALGWIFPVMRGSFVIDRLDRAQDGGFRHGLPGDARHAAEAADAAQRALEDHLDLELVARHHRFLEARVVDADVVVHRALALLGGALAAEHHHPRRLRHRLQDQHAGHDRPARKMALEMRLVRR